MCARGFTGVSVEQMGAARRRRDYPRWRATMLLTASCTRFDGEGRHRPPVGAPPAAACAAVADGLPWSRCLRERSLCRCFAKVAGNHRLAGG